MITGFVGKLYQDGRTATYEDVMSLTNSLSLPTGYRIEAKCCSSLAVAAAVLIQKGCTDMQLIYSDNGSRLLLGSGSIYNKEAVAASLSEKPDYTDFELLWQGWLNMGNDIVKQLSGDWMLAAYDQSKKELVLARSWGISSMYYFQGKDFIAFATQPAILAAVSGVPREPDIKVLTQILCALPVAPQASVWKSLRQLQPASMLLISQGTMREEVWWRPSYIHKRKINNEREVLDQFLSLYRKAVKRRLDTKQAAGATLSSGLDSTSVCLLAAEELLSKGRCLQAWTAIPYYTSEACSFGTWLADERELAGNFAKGISNLHHSMVDAKDSDPIDAIRIQLLRTGRPQSSVANLYWIDQILTSANVSNCNVLLTGQFGNSTVSYSPYHIPLFPKNTYYPAASFKNYLSLVKYRVIKQIKGTGKSILTAQDHKEKYPLINPKYLKTWDFKQSLNIPDNRKGITQAKLNEVHMGSFDLWYHNSFWNGIEVRDPTMDLELTEFMLTLPDHMYYQDNVDRRMLRLGFLGLLPDAIRLNRHRGQQASDIVPRVRHNKQQAAKALSIISQSAMANELLNLERMNMIFDRITQGETGLKIFKECSRILLPGLSAGLFLATFDTDFDISTPLG